MRRGKEERKQKGKIRRDKGVYIYIAANARIKPIAPIKMPTREGEVSVWRQSPSSKPRSDRTVSELQAGADTRRERS